MLDLKFLTHNALNTRFKYSVTQHWLHLWAETMLSTYFSSFGTELLWHDLQQPPASIFAFCPEKQLNASFTRFSSGFSSRMFE